MNDMSWVEKIGGKGPSRRKLLTEWSKAVRGRDGCCVVCHRTEFLQAHHLIPKERFKQWMYEVDNGVTLCARCHKFGNYSAHRHPIWFAEWLKENKPDLYSLTTERIKRDNDRIADNQAG